MIGFFRKKKQLEIIVCDHFTVLLDESTNNRGFVHAVFDMLISILWTLIWVCPNLILSQVKTASNNNSNFWSYQSRNKKINAMYSPLNSIVIILAQKVTSIFLATLVIWTPFSPLTSVFFIFSNEQKQSISVIHYLSNIKTCWWRKLLSWSANIIL